MDSSSIPRQYGGELDWQWGDMPNLDEPARTLLQGLEQHAAEGQNKKEILKGPMLFQGDKIEVLGTEGGKDRRLSIPVPAPRAENQTPYESTGATADGEVEVDEKMAVEKAVNVNGIPTATTTAAA